MAVNPQQILLNYCIQKMNLGAMILGVSNSKAAQGGNLAFIEVRNNGNVLLHKQAFSNSSSLPKAVKADFASSVPQTSLGLVGIPNGNQHANHTEPKLLEHIKNNFGVLNGGFDEIIIASEMDCCASCVKNTISAITGWLTLSDMSNTNAITFQVVEMNSGRVRQGHEF